MDDKPAGLFTTEMLKGAILSELAEARAKAGICPKCQERRLRYLTSGGGVSFRQCADCSTVVVLPT